MSGLCESSPSDGSFQRLTMGRKERLLQSLYRIVVFTALHGPHQYHPLGRVLHRFHMGTGSTHVSIQKSASRLDCSDSFRDGPGVRDASQIHPYLYLYAFPSYLHPQAQCTAHDRVLDPPLLSGLSSLVCVRKLDGSFLAVNFLRVVAVPCRVVSCHAMMMRLGLPILL
ncbi:hypothetical protein LZ32DRAFT_128872 [Colletotrichum eremochloae]|nr:hypothetical protein LZ32DRAFT_128872 [Colletotrichum eremochloae]